MIKFGDQLLIDPWMIQAMANNVVGKSTLIATNSHQFTVNLTFEEATRIYLEWKDSQKAPAS